MLSEKKIKDTLKQESENLENLETCLDSDYAIDSVDFLVTKGWVEALQYVLEGDADIVSHYIDRLKEAEKVINAINNDSNPSYLTKLKKEYFNE